MRLIAILGATGTIGSVLARRLVHQGQRVLLVGRTAEKLKSLSEELSQPYVTADLGDSEALEEALLAVPDAHGGFLWFRQLRRFTSAEASTCDE